MAEGGGNGTGSKRRFSRLDPSYMSGEEDTMDQPVHQSMEIDSYSVPRQKGLQTPENQPQHNGSLQTDNKADTAQAESEQERRDAISQLLAQEDDLDRTFARKIAKDWWDEFQREDRHTQMPPVDSVVSSSSSATSVSQSTWNFLEEWYGVDSGVKVSFAIVGGFMTKIPAVTTSLTTLIGDLIPQDPLVESYAGVTLKAAMSREVFRKLDSRRLDRDWSIADVALENDERIILVKNSSITPGTSGLTNLGNTCYMNSALQILLHIEEVANYFLSGAYKEDINTKNPIGHGGQVARSFAQLLVSLYTDSSAAFSPYSFKSTIGRFNRAFAGYMQQDSQEFTAFLLDGLHEDLNKVLEKPVTEAPELDDDKVDDPQAVADLAQKVWDLNQKRNDSVIRDLFTGMYKSTLVCPVCHKVSITFDPFGDLTLPLPTTSAFFHTVTVVPLDGPIVSFEAALTSRDVIFAVKKQGADVVGLAPELFSLADVFNGRLFAIHEDNSLVIEKIKDNDTVVLFQTRRNSASDDVTEVPLYVYSRWTPPPSSTWFGTPLVVMVSPTDSLEEIRSKVRNRFASVLIEDAEVPQFKLLRLRGSDQESLYEHYIDNSRLIYLDEAPDTMNEASQGTPAQMDIEPALPDSPASSDISSLSGPISSPTRKYEVDEKPSIDGAPDQEDTKAGTHEVIFGPHDVIVAEFSRSEKPEIAAANSMPNPIAIETHTQLRNKTASTLDNCLDLFEQSEVLGENDLWYCSRCKDFRQATKKMDIWRVGDIFTIHLKRFSDFQSHRDKISDLITFPIQGLDLSSRIRGPHDKDLVYDLIGVDNHYGGLNGGHYTSYAKNPVDGNWYYFDDSRVTPTDPAKAVSPAAYILFYRRRSSKPLGGLPETKLTESIEHLQDLTEVGENNSQDSRPKLAASPCSSPDIPEAASSPIRFPGAGNRLGGPGASNDFNEEPLEDAPWSVVPHTLGAIHDSLSEID